MGWVQAAAQENKSCPPSAKNLIGVAIVQAIIYGDGYQENSREIVVEMPQNCPLPPAQQKGMVVEKQDGVAMFVCLCVLVLARIKFVFSGFQQFGRCMSVFEASSRCQTIHPASHHHLHAHCRRCQRAARRWLKHPAYRPSWPVRCQRSAQAADISRPAHVERYS